MKILYLVSGIGPPAGWGTEFIQEVIFKLSQKGVKATVINPIYKHTSSNWSSWSKEQEEKHGVRIISLEAPTVIKQNLYLYFALTPLFVTWAVFKLLRKEKYDIIHEFSSTPLVLLRSLLIKLVFNTPTVFSLSVFNNTLLGSFFWFKFFNFAHTYCLPSQEIIKSLRAIGIGQNKIKFVPPGLNLRKFTKNISKLGARRGLNLPQDKFIATYFGSLTHEKGIGNLIAAADLIPPQLRSKILFIFWAVWKGSNQHKKYVKLIKGLNRSNLRLEEKYVNIPTALAASDVILLPQQTGHGATIPQISIIETLAAGKKVVATDIIGNREFFVNPEEVLVEPNNPRELAQKIEEIYTKSPRQKVKVNLKIYDTSNVAASYFRIYNGLLRKALF